MKRYQLVIGMLMVGMMLGLTGCSGAPSNSLVKKTFVAEYATDSCDGVSVPMVEFKIVDSGITSDPQETFYNFVVEAHYTKKFTKEETQQIVKVYGKSESMISYDLVQQYKMEFVKRRGEWFHTSEKGHQVSQTFGH